MPGDRRARCEGWRELDVALADNRSRADCGRPTGPCCNVPGVSYVLALALVAVSILLRGLVVAPTTRRPVASHLSDAGGADCRHRRRSGAGAAGNVAQPRLAFLRNRRSFEYLHRTRVLPVPGRTGARHHLCAARHRHRLVRRTAANDASPGGRERGSGAGPRGAPQVDPRYRSGRHGGHRRARDHAVVQRRRRAPVRLSARRGARQERQHADAVALSRGP